MYYLYFFVRLGIVSCITITIMSLDMKQRCFRMLAPVLLSHFVELILHVAAVTTSCPITPCDNAAILSLGKKKTPSQLAGHQLEGFQDFWGAAKERSLDVQMCSKDGRMDFFMLRKLIFPPSPSTSLLFLKFCFGSNSCECME